MIEKQLDVLSVGDFVTDTFIKLLDNKARVEKVADGQFLILPFATKVPFDHTEVVEGVGNAANASVAFARLGLSSGLVANIGDDNWGLEIIRALRDNKVDTRFVHANAGKSSNYHHVLW